MAQLARPSSDVAKNGGTWVDQAGATLDPSTNPAWPLLDEATPDDDTTYAQANSSGANNWYEVKLASLTDPSSSSGHILRVRARKSLASGQATGATFWLYQSTTLIATLDITPGDADFTAGWTTKTLTLSGAEADSITDYSDLRVRWLKTVSGTGTARSVRTTQIELEVPSASTAVEGTIAQTLPALEQDASASATVTAATAGVLPAFTQDAAADLTASAAAASTLPTLTQDASTEARVEATAQSTLPALTQGASASATVAGSADSTLPQLEQDAAGTVEVEGITGSAAQTLPALGQAAQGTLTVTGAATSGLPALTQDAAAEAAVQAQAASTLGALISASGGVLTVSGEGASALPALAQDAAGQVELVAVGRVSGSGGQGVTEGAGTSEGTEGAGRAGASEATGASRGLIEVT